MAGDDAEFDRILARVGGPLGVEMLDVDATARSRWETYATANGWAPIEWFDMPGAFAWRRDPPGTWEMTWQQTTGAREMFELRLMPPEHSLVWRRQVVGLLRDLGETLGRDVVLVDERSAMPLLRFDPDRGDVRIADRPAARSLAVPPDPICCDAMAATFATPCDTCVDPHDCPNQVLLYFPTPEPGVRGDYLPTPEPAVPGEFGLPIRDGGSSYLAITHCPWCGARVPIVSGRASQSADPPVAD